jgi:hypothetical protein
VRSKKCDLLKKDVVFLGQQLKPFRVVAFLSDVGVVFSIAYYFEVLSLFEREVSYN